MGLAGESRLAIEVIAAVIAAGSRPTGTLAPPAPHAGENGRGPGVFTSCAALVPFSGDRELEDRVNAEVAD
jgi:hypothetical protein